MSSSDSESSESFYTSTSHSKQHIIPHTSNTWQSKMNLQLESLSNRIYLMEIYNKYPVMKKPSEPTPRRSIHTRSKSRGKEEGQSLTNNSSGSDMRDTCKQQKNSGLSENKESSSDGNESSDEQTRIQNEIEKKEQLRRSRNRSRTISPKKTNVSSEDVFSGLTPESYRHSFQNETKSAKSTFMLSKLLCVIVFFSLIFLMLTNFGTTQSQNNNENQEKNHNSIFKCIEDVKAKFHNQESDSWNDIASAIDEVKISRTLKMPSIILLFANETRTMNCLATKLANTISNIISHTNNYKNFNPEDFGDDCCDIIDRVKHLSSVRVMVIRDILNINAKAIRALHFLCDKFSPLIDDAIYILTMKTNNYQPSKKKLAFVEEHIKLKLSKSIDKDILMPLITRITDGAIISVQRESNLEHCENDV